MSVYCKEGAWGKREKTLVARAIDKTIKVAESVFDRCERGTSPQVDATLTDDQESQTLNLCYRNVDAPTNVLSFPLPPLQKKEVIEGEVDQAIPNLLGDIVLARGVIQREARNNSYEKHLARVVIHGVLHLLGCDHQDKKEERTMTFWEERICYSLHTTPLLSLSRVEA